MNRRGTPILRNTVCKFLSKMFNQLFEENYVKTVTVSSTSLQSDQECISGTDKITDDGNAIMDLGALRLKT